MVLFNLGLCGEVSLFFTKLQKSSLMTLRHVIFLSCVGFYTIMVLYNFFLNGLIFGLQLDCSPSRRTRNINFPTNRKGYDKSETTCEKHSARRIQICRVYFCVIDVDLFFKITFQIHKVRTRIDPAESTRLIKYSCAEVSGSFF